LNKLWEQIRFFEVQFFDVLVMQFIEVRESNAGLNENK